MIARICEFYQSIPVLVRVTVLLCCSNLFMLYAWYGHLKNMEGKPYLLIVLVSWSVALFEYMLMIPANRLGNTAGLSLAQLKIMQEVITLAMFVPFSLVFMKRNLSWDFLWAGLCMCGAVYFIFRK